MRPCLRGAGHPGGLRVHARASLQAARPLFTGNCAAIAQKGPQNALSGPIERNDIETVRKHLAALDGQTRETYATLSLSVCELPRGVTPSVITLR